MLQGNFGGSSHNGSQGILGLAIACEAERKWATRPGVPKMYLGIDIGGTKIAGALVDEYGVIANRADSPTDAALGGPHVLEVALSLAVELVAMAKEPIVAIGIGAGGQIDADHGVVVSATDVLPGWAGTRIADAFAAKFGVTVVVDNDVNALAAGEARFGAARGYKTVAFLALGTGVGGALLIDGRIHHGAHWTGGEFGHLLIDMVDDARKDVGGARGTLEAYASGPGLVATYRAFSGDITHGLTGRDVVADADLDPDSPAALAITRTGEYLGFGLASLANILDPDIFVIGGGVAEIGERLLGPARAVLSTRALPGPATCPVVTASLGRDASVIGAASLAMP